MLEGEELFLGSQAQLEEKAGGGEWGTGQMAE